MNKQSKQSILDKLPVFTADADYLRINNGRYQVMAISKVEINTHYFMGLDDTPGITTFKLIINNDSIYLENIIAHEEIVGEFTLILTTLNEYVNSIKKAINF